MARQRFGSALLTAAEQERYLRLLNGSPQLRAAVSAHAGQPVEAMTYQRKVAALAAWRQAEGLDTPAAFSAGLRKLDR